MKTWGNIKNSTEYVTVMAPLISELRARGLLNWKVEAYADSRYAIVFDDALVDVRVSMSVTQRMSATDESRRRRLHVTVGNTTYRGRNALRFPEPKAGFDFKRMADAVEMWRRYRAQANAIEKERKGKYIAWLKKLRALPDDLREYSPRVSMDGEYVTLDLKATTIKQVRAVLKAARAAGVEP